MNKRSIHIAPIFDCQDVIEAFRRGHDPLHGHVGPHITLVFPFESDLDAHRIRSHVQASVAGIEPFELSLSPLITTRGGYLAMEVDQGSRLVVELHRRLYTEELARFLDTTTPYRPHVTVGRTSQQRTAVLPVQPVALVEEVVVEVIADNDDSIPETAARLGN